MHVPVWVVVLSLAGFVRLYLNAGRWWLLWTLCGLRTFSLLLNFLLGENLNYWTITRLRQVHLLGETVSVVGQGISNHWMLLGQASFLLLLIFVVDASLTACRQGDRRRALVVGGSVVFFVLIATTEPTLVLWEIIHWPVVSSLPALVPVAAMAFELSRDAQRAGQLARDLGENKERMSLALSSARLGLWNWDVKTDARWVSEEVRIMFDFPREGPVTNEMFVKRTHPDDRERRASVLAKALADRTEYQVEFRVLRDDGSIRWVDSRGRCHLDTDGTVDRVLGAIIDIHDRKVAEQQLQESETRFRTVADSAPVFIWMSGIDMLCTFLNKPRLDFTGRTFEQERGNGWEKVVHPDDLAGCLRTYQEAFAARRPFVMQYRLKRHDGEYRWLLNHGVPRFEVGGKFEGYIGSCIDITERKQHEEQLQTALAEVKQLKDQLSRENAYLRQEMSPLNSPDKIVGQSPAIRRTLELAEQVAGTGSTVLLLGETGSGKELIASMIHDRSPRRDRIMVRVNCAAIPTALIESELFGRERGAYTGALSKQIGRFEMADHSTLFLDEIGELSAEVQVKLLRVLQEKQLERLGSSKPVQVDVRIIAATNKNLEQAVRDGRFREDLYYRLNVFPIQVPPLRERREDLVQLVWAFVGEFGKALGKNVESISAESLAAIQSYAWPGNVRELRNVIERAMIVAIGPKLKIELPISTVTDFPAPVVSKGAGATARSLTIKDTERDHILNVLEMTGWRVRGKNGAAEILEINPTTLESRMAKLGIVRKRM